MRFLASLVFYVFFLVPLVSASEPILLSDYLAEVRERNLGLKIDGARAEATEGRSVGLAIPPPMAAFAQMKDDAGISRGFEITQTIPFPTKLISNRSARKEESRSENEIRFAREAETLAEAKRIYFTLWFAQEKISVLNEKKEALGSHIKLARSGVRSDSFLKIHLLKSESDFDLLENEIAEANQSLLEARAKAAEFINRDFESFDRTATEPPESKVPTKPEKIGYSHQLNAKRHSLESIKFLESESKSSWLPDLSLRYKQMGAGSMFGRYNEFTVGATLPFIFFWEPNASSRDSTLKRIQAEFELEEVGRRIENERYLLTQRATSLRTQLESIKSRLIPRAKSRMGLVHNIVPRDMESLQDHRETMEAFPELRLRALELRFAYETTVSELEKYLFREAASHE